MKIEEFKLERYFAEHEFTARYLLSSSDCDGYDMKYVLDQASKEESKLWNNLTLGYTESEGNSMLRASILQYYNIKSIENVVVASPGELNYILMNVLLEASDHVISIAPSYQSLYEVVRSIGCELSYWKPEPGNWEFNPDQLKDLIRSNTKLIIINFPHNPTGSYITESQLLEIIAIAEQQGCYLFSDEMYHKLNVSDFPELPPATNLYDKAISLWGTSKTFGMAGLRTGWLVSQSKNIIEKVIAFKDYLSICNSAPSEILSLIALNNPEKFIAPNIQKIRENIELFDQFSLEHGAIKSFTKPRAGSTAFVPLNIEGASMEFSEKLVVQSGIMTVPSAMFNYDGNYIRIGFGRKNFRETLRHFSDYLNEKS